MKRAIICSGDEERLMTDNEEAGLTRCDVTQGDECVERETGELVGRIITTRKLSRHERKAYEEGHV